MTKGNTVFWRHRIFKRRWKRRIKTNKWKTT